MGMRAYLAILKSQNNMIQQKYTLEDAINSLIYSITKIQLHALDNQHPVVYAELIEKHQHPQYFVSEHTKIICHEIGLMEKRLFQGYKLYYYIPYITLKDSNKPIAFCKA